MINLNNEWSQNHHKLCVVRVLYN